MTSSRVTLAGFREWAAVIRALEEGDQTCLIRKGSKENKRFDLRQRRFWLVPSYIQQSEEMFQPPYRKYIEETNEQRSQLGENRVRISSWAEARFLMTIKKMERLNWLTDHTVYSPQCFQERFQFRPGQVLYLLVVRVFNLSEPRFLPLPSSNGEGSEEEVEEAPEHERNRRGMLKYHETGTEEGSDWVQLQQRIPLAADNPAVPDADFEQRKETIRERFVLQDEDRPEPWLF